MSCPNCDSENWDYTGEPPIIHELDDVGYAILLDFPCHCPECECTFYRREEFVHAGKKTAWFVEESE